MKWPVVDPVFNAKNPEHAAECQQEEERRQQVAVLKAAVEQLQAAALQVH